MTTPQQLVEKWRAEVAEFDARADPHDPEDWMEYKRDCIEELAAALAASGEAVAFITHSADALSRMSITAAGIELGVGKHALYAAPQPVISKQAAPMVWREDPNPSVIPFYPAPQPASDGWRDIESAPKDGRLLVCCRRHRHIFLIDAEEVHRASMRPQDAGFYTHWQPLPPPPAARGDWGEQ